MRSRRPILGSVVAVVLLIATAGAHGISLRPGDVIVSDTSLDAILVVDPVTGDRRILSSVSVGSGPGPVEPQGVAVEADGSILFAERWTEQVIRVDPLTGDRSVVTDSAAPGVVGSGPPLGIAWGIVVVPGGDILAASNVGAGGLVMRIDPVTGDRTEVTSPTLGTGDVLGGVRSVLQEANGDVVVLDEGGVDKVVRVDPATGNRSLLSQFNWAGSGPSFTSPRDITLASDQDILITSAQERRLMNVDAVSGDRETLSGCESPSCNPPLGSGPAYFNWSGVRREVDDDLLVIYPNDAALARIQGGSGDREAISDGVLGSGPNFGIPQWIDLVPAGVLVADPADGPLSVTMVRGFASPIPLPGEVTLNFTPLVEAIVLADFGVVPSSTLAMDPLEEFVLPPEAQVWTVETSESHEPNPELVLSYDESLFPGIDESRLIVRVTPETGPDLLCSTDPAVNTCPALPLIDTVANTITIQVPQLPVTVVIGGPPPGLPSLPPTGVLVLVLALALGAGATLAGARVDGVH